MELPLINSDRSFSNSGDDDDDDADQGLPLLPRLAKKGLRERLAPFNNWITEMEEHFRTFLVDNSRAVNILLFTIFVLGWFSYVIIACLRNIDRARDLIYLTAIFTFCVVYWLVKKYFGDVIRNSICNPIQQHINEKYWTILKLVFIVLIMVSILSWLIYDTSDEPKRLISLVGLFVYVFIGFVFSANKSEIRWRTILWGFILQFILGVITLRTYIGYEVFKWLGNVIQIFLGFASEGGSFVFGDILNHGLIKVLPILVYFSAFTYCIYYLGLIQVPICKIAWLLRITMGTTTAESFNAAANIFIGQVEAPLLIRPFLKSMTSSELHAVMTVGFATISGSLFAVYITFGISAQHLLAASVMSAPAALAMSKLMYPEVEKSEFEDVDEIQVERTDEKNIFEAITVGAAMSIGLVANIVAMVIAFISLLACADAVLGWLGSMAGVPEFSFEFICSYVFMPFAYIMGVSWNDSFNVAKLIGIKTMLNEFIAYKKLSVLITNREDGIGNTISKRSETIATYALCGFANFGSVGIQLGSLSVLAPSKSAVLSKLVLRALCAGTLSCFMSACIAGLLYNDQQTMMSSNHSNITGSPFNNTRV